MRDSQFQALTDLAAPKTMFPSNALLDLCVSPSTPTALVSLMLTPPLCALTVQEDQLSLSSPMILTVQDALRSKHVHPTNLIALSAQASSPIDLTTPLFHISPLTLDALAACHILLPSPAAPADLTALKHLQPDLINLPDLPLPPHLLISTVQEDLQEKYVHLTNLPALSAQALSLTVPLAHLFLPSSIVLVLLPLTLVSIALPAPLSDLIDPRESKERTTPHSVHPPLNSQVDLRGDRTSLREVTTPLQVPLTDLFLLLVSPLPELSMTSRESLKILTVSLLRSA